MFPTPKYSIGDIVYDASVVTDEERLPCPDCKSTGSWPFKTPAGMEVEARCLRCHGRAALIMHAYRGVVHRRTIGSVRFDTANEREPIEYMCRETGIGTGQIYRESRLYSDEETAQCAADAAAQARRAEEMAFEANKKAYDRFIRLSTMDIRTAQLDEAEQRLSETQQRLQALLDRICNLDRNPMGGPPAKHDDHLFPRDTTLTQVQVEIIQEHLVRGDQEFIAYLDQFRQERG